ncbi:MAG TPA: hypothetical protein VE910_04360 [Dongiaceae bacterium]|jgi:hypothetical protein|nr:hypothetical protein [Dongiaceae bacterium]
MRTLKVLVQTTTPAKRDNWTIDSFLLLREHLASLQEMDTRFEVTARNRDVPIGAPDAVLSRLDESDLDELWLFALDFGEGGLTPDDCAGISRFRQRGGGILSARDHQDMGISLCTLGGIGRAHFFHTKNPEPDVSRQTPDDRGTPTISWPNYHSGRNGDFQRIVAAEPRHELLRNPSSPSGLIELFPAHPHEGAVGVPEGEASAQVIATGHSLATDRPFNLAVAFERTMDRLGRGVAESSIHHFADYNWDTSRGAPSFVTEPEGTGMKDNPRALADIKQYVRNLAFWLAPGR